MSEELYHHGVLGMKWGHRKAMALRAKAKQYKSMADFETRSRKKQIKNGTAVDKYMKRSEDFSNKYYAKAEAARAKANAILAKSKGKKVSQISKSQVSKGKKAVDGITWKDYATTGLIGVAMKKKALAKAN